MEVQKPISTNGWKQQFLFQQSKEEEASHAWVDYDLSSDKKLVARIHQIYVNTARVFLASFQKWAKKTFYWSSIGSLMHM